MGRDVIRLYGFCKVAEGEENVRQGWLMIGADGRTRVVVVDEDESEDRLGETAQRCAVAVMLTVGERLWCGKQAMGRDHQEES